MFYVTLYFIQKFKQPLIVQCAEHHLLKYQNIVYVFMISYKEQLCFRVKLFRLLLCFSMQHFFSCFWSFSKCLGPVDTSRVVYNAKRVVNSLLHSLSESETSKMPRHLH